LNLENIVLENIDIEVDNGLICIDTNGITLKDMRLVLKNLPGILIKNSLNVSIESIDIPGKKNPCIDIGGEKSKINPGIENGARIVDEVDKGTIKIL
jgi:hypothetical protein